MPKEQWVWGGRVYGTLDQLDALTLAAHLKGWDMGGIKWMLTTPPGTGWVPLYNFHKAYPPGVVAHMTTVALDDYIPAALELKSTIRALGMRIDEDEKHHP